MMGGTDIGICRVARTPVPSCDASDRWGIWPTTYTSLNLCQVNASSSSGSSQTPTFVVRKPAADTSKRYDTQCSHDLMPAHAADKARLG
jgi:hypothetical protein